MNRNPAASGRQAGVTLRDVVVSGVDTNARANTLKSLLIGKGWHAPRPIPILRGVTFEARPGERIGIVGVNGSGKSSLLKVISGNYPIHGGTRQVSGTIAPLIEMGAGFDTEMTGRRNIKLTYAARGRLRDYSSTLERDIIEFSELGDKIDLPLKTYSSGMVARLAFSSAIFQDPDILLLDEVFAVGDPAFVEKSRRILMEKMDRASITLIVSQAFDVVLSCCSRGILMESGRIVAEGEVGSIVERYREYLAQPARASGARVGA